MKDQTRNGSVKRTTAQPGTARAITRVSEICLWVIGISCLSISLGFGFKQRAFAQSAAAEFLQTRSIESRSNVWNEHDFGSAVDRSIATANQELWSDNRIQVFQASIKNIDVDVLAVLRIPRLSVEAPVFYGALDTELDRGPGWIRGTGGIGEIENIGIAGHRDGYFRALKDIELGDEISVVDPKAETRYTVTDIWIVNPEDVEVLDPTDTAALTLVTCYPFYFVGHAPKRFIVRAVAQ